MAGGLLNTAISGLRVFQRNLDTVSHNIANVDTEGYSRQRVTTSTRTPQITGAGYVGTGVETTGISRVYDAFLNTQVLTSSSAFSDLESFHSLAAQVDNFIADPRTSLTPTLQAFFNAVHEVADDPTSIPARQVMLIEAETLADRFFTMSKRMNELATQANQKLNDVVDEINTLSDSIAELNDKIITATALANGSPPNDLLDQRDVLLKQLSEKIDVKTSEQEDAALNVFIGKGQAIVLGATAATLGITGSKLDPTQKDITFNGRFNSVVITGSLTGGELGGTLRFFNEVLNSTQNELGRVAAGLALEFNAQHQTGYDLTGNTNLDFFNLPSITVLGDAANTGQITVAYDAGAVGQLAASDYRLDRSGADYFLTRISDNTQSTLSPGFPGVAASIDGIIITESAAIADGDSFLIRPTYDAAAKMSIAISDPTQVAAGLDPAPGAVGDNSNALALADLATQRRLLNGTATFQDAFGKTVADVGTVTHAAEVNKTAQQVLLNQAREARESVSGVNLDEEAANLVKYQQAYQAAAQVIAVTGTLFDSLLGAFRR